MDRQEINQLFDTVEYERGVRECAIFEAVYPDKSAAHAKLLHFLHHVDECAPEVIGYCQELLAPKPVESAPA